MLTQLMVTLIEVSERRVWELERILEAQECLNYRSEVVPCMGSHVP